MKDNLEFNILGCCVRVKADQDDFDNAKKAIDLVNLEVEQLQNSNSNLKPVDIAVLSALKLASKSIDLEFEYKENVLALRSSVKDALEHVEEISSADSDLGNNEPK